MTENIRQVSELTKARDDFDPEKFKLREDPRKLLAFHTDDAREILIGPEGYKEYLDNIFIQNSRKLYMFYEALQNSLSRTERQSGAVYPNVKELNRYLSIHKRSISDRSPMLSEEESLLVAIILAGQRLPFIHILRKMLHSSAGIEFETNFAAPIEGQSQKVLLAYRSMVQQAHLTLKKFINSDYETVYLDMCNRSLRTHNNPEPRVGRVDYELRKMFIDENLINPIPPNYANYIQRINQELFRRIYKSLILDGIQSKTLVSFDCDNLRTNAEGNSAQFYDIVHFASPNYLSKRYKLLSQFLERSYFGEWWNHDAQNLLLKRNPDLGSFEQAQYTQKLASVLLKPMRERSDLAPRHLVHLTTEIIKLAEWYFSHEKHIQQKRKQEELDSLLNNLRKVENVYQIKDKKWLKENWKTLLTVLRSKGSDVLACTHPYISPFQIGEDFDPLAARADVYLMLKDKKASAKAVQLMEKLYKKNGDVTLLRVLENLFAYHSEKREVLKEYIAPVYLDRFEELLNDFYLAYLPWWSRLYYLLAGKTLSKKQMSRFKAKLDLVDGRSLLKHALKKPSKGEKTKASDKVMQKLQKERLERKEARKFDENKVSPEEKILVKKTCIFLEEEWEKNHYPTHKTLLTMAGEEADLMGKIISSANLNGYLSYPILAIHIHGRDNIYASRPYLQSRRLALIKNFKSEMEREETYTIRNRTYLNTDSKNKFLYKGIIDYLKNNPNL